MNGAAWMPRSWQWMPRLLLVANILAFCFVDAEEWNETTFLRSSRRRNAAEGRIVGGIPAGRKEFPSYVHGGGCGGTLIRPHLVLTAGHCADNFEDESIRVGRNRRNAGIRIQVKESTVHPNLNEKTFENDIAIVKLSCSIRNATLQVLNLDDTKPADGDTVVTIGFGDIREGGPSSVVLLKTQVNVVPQKLCKQRYNGIYNIYKKEMICAGAKGGGRDSCQGDSGGPLYGPDGRQVGIVSFGVGCGMPKYPGVYTRISHYKEFINDMIQEYSDPIPPYC